MEHYGTLYTGAIVHVQFPWVSFSAFFHWSPCVRTVAATVRCSLPPGIRGR